MKKLPTGLEWLPLVFLGVSASLATAPEITAEAIVLTVAEAEGHVGKRVTIPVTVEHADRLGPLQFVLTYDPAVLQPLAVEPGSLARASMVHDELPEPGTLRVATITQGPIDGDGNLIEIEFEVLAANQSSRLELVHARAWEWESLRELLVDTRAGTFTAAGPSWTTRIVLAATALALVLLGLLITGRRKRLAVAHASA